MNDLWQYEAEMKKMGYSVIAGTDEAGRGPLAGPVFAAAVILPFGEKVDHLNDSKKLSEKRREFLFDVIVDISESYAVSMSDEKEIDDINILNATFVSMKRAIDSLRKKPDKMCIRDRHCFEH